MVPCVSTVIPGIEVTEGGIEPTVELESVAGAATAAAGNAIHAGRAKLLIPTIRMRRKLGLVTLSVPK